MNLASPRQSPDLFAPELVLGEGCARLLAAFNRAGLLLPSDVHTAQRVGRIGEEEDELVLLGVAFAVRAPRVGHVSADLATIRSVAVASEDVDPEGLPWPEPLQWLEKVASSSLVAAGEGAEDRPLRLLGSRLYLDRYWRDEMAVATALRSRAAQPLLVESQTLLPVLTRLFASAGDEDQLRAARTAATRAFTVVAGGPGTGKTTTVARLLAALLEDAAALGKGLPVFALAAPTGKAAQRLELAVHSEAASLGLTSGLRSRLEELSGSTIHRLLGRRPGSSRYHYNSALRLPHDVVVVDEASMVSLALMARLLEALRPEARLVLLGDPEQLVSVEAGAVLADVVGPAGSGLQAPGYGLGWQGGSPGAAWQGQQSSSPMEGSIVVLGTNHRFSGALAELAEAVRAGDGDRVLAVLDCGDPAVAWIDAEPHEAAGALREPILEWTRPMLAAARAGDVAAALAALGRHRVLCAHRRGPDGVLAWNERIEAWLCQEWPELAVEGQWYAGRPLMVTSNDYGLQLFNGDTGVVAAGGRGGETSAFFEDGGNPRSISPSRLGEVETVYAATVHKSQGSEFERVTLLLPRPGSPLLVRQLLYTAVTRARRELLVVGTEQAVRTAVSSPLARASGLAERLWSRSGVQEQ